MDSADDNDGSWVIAEMMTISSIMMMMISNE